MRRKKILVTDKHNDLSMFQITDDWINGMTLEKWKTDFDVKIRIIYNKNIFTCTRTKQAWGGTINMYTAQYTWSTVK